MLRGDALGRRARVLLALLALGLASAVWLPCLHLCFRSGDARPMPGVSARARALAARQLELWSAGGPGQAELRKMRQSNAEWDFMARTYLVLALGNMALRDPSARSTYLAQIDRLIDETLRLEQEKGPYFFLMDYARDRPFKVQPPRSLFIDGEIALMLATRRMVEEEPRYAKLLPDRVRAIVERMSAGPVRCAESYPDECWIFCNAVALAAIRMADALDGTDHRAFFEEWLRAARSRLTDRATGLLISSFHLDGERRDGPEGSSIWMAAHCLQLIDESFARDQYVRAKRELGRALLGFGYAREWPPSQAGPRDIDSGPVIPLLEASPASSGLALLGAAAFEDQDYLAQLVASLDFAAFPVQRRGMLHYAASNRVGDAVVLYALVQGPLWKAVKERGRR